MKLSIIIPAYNIDKYIDNCLLSCLSQDLELNRDYEIIVVNDGSTDQTLSRISKYENIIKIINQPNGGVSDARNNGLKCAKGDYVWFIDGDDYIEENCLAFLLNIITRMDLDILTVGYREVVEEDDFYIKNTFLSTTGLKVEDSFTTELVIWNSIIKREYLLEYELWFIKGMKYGEDTLWMSLVELFTQKHKRLNLPIYKYRIRTNSAVHTHNESTKLQRFVDMQTMQEVWLNVITQHSDKISLDQRKQLETRISWCTSNILLAALEQNKQVRKNTLLKLKKNGSYPYKIIWTRISLRYGLKNFLVTIFTLFFPLEIYYRIIAYLFGKK